MSGILHASSKPYISHLLPEAIGLYTLIYDRPDMLLALSTCYLLLIVGIDQENYSF